MASYPDYTESIAQLEGVQARSLGTIGNAIQAAPQAIGAAGTAMEGIGKNLEEARFTALKAQGLTALEQIAQEKGHTPEQIAVYKSIWNQPDGQNKAYLMFQNFEKQNYQDKIDKEMMGLFPDKQSYIAAKTNSVATGEPITPPTDTGEPSVPPAVGEGTSNFSPEAPFAGNQNNQMSMETPVDGMSMEQQPYVPPAVGETLPPPPVSKIPEADRKILEEYLAMTGPGSAAKRLAFRNKHPNVNFRINPKDMITKEGTIEQATTPGAATPNTAPGKAVSPMYTAPDGETPSNTMTGNTDNINLKKLNMPIENQKDFDLAENVTKSRLKAMGVSQETLDAMTPTMELMAAIHFNQPESEKEKFLKKIQSNPILMADLTHPDSVVRKAIDAFPDTVDKDNFLTAIGTYSAKTFDTVTKAETAQNKIDSAERMLGRKFTQQDKTEIRKLMAREKIADQVDATRRYVADLRNEAWKENFRFRQGVKNNSDFNNLSEDALRLDEKHHFKTANASRIQAIKDFGLWGGDDSGVKSAGISGYLFKKYPGLSSFAEQAAKDAGFNSMAAYISGGKSQQQQMQKLIYQTILKYAATTFSPKTEDQLRKMTGDKLEGFGSIDELKSGLQQIIQDAYNDDSGSWSWINNRAEYNGIDINELTDDFTMNKTFEPEEIARRLRTGESLTRESTPSPKKQVQDQGAVNVEYSRSGSTKQLAAETESTKAINKSKFKKGDVIKKGNVTFEVMEE